MNVCINGSHAASAAIRNALESAGHTVSAATNLREKDEALVVLPSSDLEHATRGTYELLCAAADAGVRQVVLVSSLAFFDRLPQNWKLTTMWRPRPSPALPELSCYLSELSAREITRVSQLRTHCLRLGGDVSDTAAADAVVAALSRPTNATTFPEWTVEHLGTATGRPEPDFRAWEDVLAPPEPIASRPIRKVVVFGAGGPLGAAVAQELASDYRLRLTDVRQLDEIAREGKLQSPGAPLPVPVERLPDPPLGRHESTIVDVRDPAQVIDACAGMDAIVNCSVVRGDPEGAFGVNTLGALHMAKAAAAHGIRRFVQTGPQLITYPLSPGDYSWDYEIACDAPPRPGRHLYGHSKFLGQQVLQIYAEWYGLEVVNLMFTAFADAKIPKGFYPMIVSWRDSARIIRSALEAASLPSPYEDFNVTASLPHAKFRNDKIRRILGWQAQDGLELFWQDRQPD